MRKRTSGKQGGAAGRLLLPSIHGQLTKGELESVAAILQLGLSEEPLDELLSRALELVLSAPAFPVRPVGCLYLADSGEWEMRLVAALGRPEQQCEACDESQTPCCGWKQEAGKGEVVYIDRSVQPQGAQHPKAETERYYRVAIRDEGELLGVLNVCPAEERQRQAREVRFATVAADILAGLIMRRRAEEASRQAHAEAERQLTQLTRALRHEVSERERAEGRLRNTAAVITRTAVEEYVIGSLLELSAKPLGMESYLQGVLDTLLSSVPWLRSLPRGAVFLAAREDANETLLLMASHGFSADMKTRCSTISFGHCLCGRAAAERQVQYDATAVDPRHEIPLAGMPSFGHYSVPILLGDSVLGVLILYLPKGYLKQDSDDAFLRRVADVLSMGITRRQAESKIEYLKDYDTLTGLPNRNLLLSQLRTTMAQHGCKGYVGAVLFIALDHFKQINNSLGRTVGDALLQELAARVAALIREGDILARVGGDEFAVLLPGESGGEDRAVRRVQAVSEKIRSRVCAPFTVDQHELMVTPSIGIALFPADKLSAGDILQQADTAMHRAKAEGRNSIRFFLPAMQKLVDQRFVIERDLRSALEKQKLKLHFQPQVDAEARLIGAEALLRCPNAQGETIPTDLCIPVAEETDLILQLGEWVLCEACSMLEVWARDGIGSALNHLCVNISPKQFYQPNFVPLVKSILAEYAVDPRQLVFEVTEGMLLESREDAIRTMQALKAMGIGLAVDDFGTGYSSLSYLTQLPLDILKIDREFVTGVVQDPRRATVVETLIIMSRQLGFDVIAEGVETREELAFLVDKDCACFQGYYFSKPKPEEEFTQYLRLLAK